MHGIYKLKWLVEMVPSKTILFYRSAANQAKWSSRKSVRGGVVISGSQARISMSVRQNTHLNTADRMIHTVGPVKFGGSAILSDQGRVGKR